MPVIGVVRIAALEFLLALTAVFAALVLPRLGWRFSLRCADALRRASSHRLACCIFVTILPVAVRLALLPWVPIPAPAIQEEFSNLLAADTLAHSRLSNLPHPLSVFFDNVQILQYPTYVSARLPGTPLFLYAGQVLFGHPWFGVCIAVAAMCGAFYWMLLAWTRPFWALICGVLFALRFGIFTYWMNSYWPGSPAALGGALVLGATPRLYRGGTLVTAILYAAGSVILVLNRPVEGILFIAPTVCAISFHWFRIRRSIALRSVLVNATVPVCLIAALSVAGMLRYNQATTGCSRVLAYSVWRSGQAIVPTFWWEPLRTEHLYYYSKQTWDFFHIFERGIYDEVHYRWRPRIAVMFWRIIGYARSEVGLLLLVPLLFPPLRLVRRRIPWLGFYFAALLTGAVGYVAVFRMSAFPEFFVLGLYAGAVLVRFTPYLGKLRLPVVILLIGFAFRLVTVFSMPTYYPHYMAPGMILVAEGFRRMFTWWRERRVGEAMARNIVLACFAMTAARAAIPIAGFHLWGEDPFYMNSYENRLTDRIRIERYLANQPGQQLAIVRYASHHEAILEWVWNGAAIDSQKIVWAREQKPEWTYQLLRYYSSRTAWLIEPDARPPRITRYPVLPPTSPAALAQAVYIDTPLDSCRR